jgi:outer membrane protein assembly factor BamB
VSRRTALLAVLGGGTAAVAGATGVAALSTRQPPPAPHLRWSAPFGEAHESMGAWAADDTTLYVCRDQDVVRALDGATGAARWTAATHALSLIPGDGVLVLAHGELVAALDAGTGRPVWELPRASTVNHAIDAGNGTVVAVVQEGVPTDPLGFPMKAIALDAATGTRLWASEQYEFVGTMRVVAGADAAYYCQDEKLIARELRTGVLRWAVPAGLDAEPLAAGEDVVVLRDGGLAAIDPTTGRLRWRVDWQVSSVAFVGGLLVVQTFVGTSRSRLSAARGVDPASGTVIWTVPPSGEPASPAVATDEFVYLSVRDGLMCAYATATGELLWSHNSGTPIAARGRDVYLLAGDELQALTGP